MKTLFLFTLLFTTLSWPAMAGISVPTFRLGLGYSSLKFTAGEDIGVDAPLESLVTINPMFMWDLPSLRARMGFHFLSDIGSPYGFISTAGMGFTALFYPMGLSSSREVKEDFSEVIKTRVSPYIQFSATPTKFSVTKQSPSSTTPSADPYVSARIVELSFGAGLDYPVARDLIMFAGLHYRNAAFTQITENTTSETSTTGSSGGLKLGGIMLLIGISTNFY